MQGSTGSVSAKVIRVAVEDDAAVAMASGVSVAKLAAAVTVSVAAAAPPIVRASSIAGREPVNSAAAKGSEPSQADRLPPKLPIPDPTASSQTMIQTSRPGGGSGELYLMNLLTAPVGSPLYRLASVLTRIESLSHILVWSTTAVTELGQDALIAMIGMCVLHWHRNKITYYRAHPRSLACLLACRVAPLEAALSAAPRQR